ncbi:hypothetical protein GDO86_002493 [Hymenochirus boettgeri]|uniref:Prolactin receptor n=1 Tax=Hymenochirus boettgeri TaxID=247094 RepID=A0A8T2KIA6_9PIPI|nr:hypothetical protein GDO86_002493 [Hymenochirus boettgeri]KAG8456729.1 hypothetical protein GDO86_002493 [Hymenochirus boettgeri]
MQQNLALVTPFIAVNILLLHHVVSLNALSPPGKPEILKCRSYEKVTFTCWWKPGPDGGLPPTYRLLYTKENDQRVYECPDYQTSGPDSCFFDKDHTSFWILYHIYVNATNALGSNVSDIKSVDVIYIVQPHPPTNVSLKIEGHNDMLVKWLPPAMVDVHTGWLTLKYEVGVKEEKDQEWEAYSIDHQLKLKLFGLTPGGNYIVRVRCIPDSGLWSEWSDASYIQIPGGTKGTDLTLWISIGVLSSVICLTLIWTMALKGCSLMSCILPPVPGPKIMGFDAQLLKSGKSDEFFSALGYQGFPPTSDYEDLLVEFLEVDDSKQHLMPSQDRGQQNQNASVCPCDTDNDSGRGSCDSPFAHFEGSKEFGVQQSNKESSEQGIQHQGPSQNTIMDGSFAKFCDNKSNIWLSTGSQNPKSSYQDIKDVNVLAFSAMNRHMLLSPFDDKTQLRHFETINEEKNTKDNDLDDKGVEADTKQLVPIEKAPLVSSTSLDYVEVHKVNQNNALALIPKHKEGNVRTDQYPAFVPGREYTKVERVEGNNVLVLMQEMANQAKPLTSETANLKFQHNQGEYHPFGPTQNNSRTMAGTMGYMDPSHFMS